jgi:vault protein inter-alpha-trypsin-like protein/VWA domain-containing protein
MKTRCIHIAKVMSLALIVISISCEEPKSTKPVKALKAVKAAPVVAGRLVGSVSTDQKGQESARRMKPGEADWTPIRGGDAIDSNDRISIAQNGTSMLTLESGGRIALNSGTVVKILSPSALLLEKGGIWVEDTVNTNANGITVKTDVGEVKMSGALAGMRYHDNKLVASVVSGAATVKGGQQEIVLHGGQEAVADSGGVQVMHVKDPGGLVSWTRELRDALAKPLGNPEKSAIPMTSGLGTLFAKVPGTGTPLPFEILAQDVTVHIQDQMALTRVEQVFKNPTNRIVEGTYKFPLPSGAQLTRYDMEIKGRMMQGEIVERQRGRAIMKAVIRQFVDMMRDPALVEWESGSTFKTRIFPILAKEKKRIVLSYIQTLEGAGGKYHYVLPVSPAGAQAVKIPAFRIDARVSSTGGVPVVTTPLYPTETKTEGRQARVGFEAHDFDPMVDFVIQIDQPNRSEAAMATYGRNTNPTNTIEKDYPSPKFVPLSPRDQDYFMINLSPVFDEVGTQETGGKDWIILADTSQSRNLLDMEIEKRLTASIIGALGPDDRVKVLAYDMKPRTMNSEFALPSKDFVSEAVSFLDSVLPAGATNIAAALEEASRHMDAKRPSRVIIIGDGAATLGENRPGELSAMAARLFNPRGASVTTIGVGSSVDGLMFEEISRQTGGRYHYLSSGEDLLAAAVQIVTGLRVPVLKNPQITFAGLGVTDVYPETLPSLGSGEEVSITGRYNGTGQLTATLLGTIGGKDWKRDYTFNVGEAKASNTFVPLLWASRRIDALTLEGDERAIKESVSLSKKYSLPSRYTSFIVLENEAMYREFNVKRGGDRFEWEGTGEIEYEDAEEQERSGDAFDDTSQIATSGAGAISRRAAGKSSSGPIAAPRASANKSAKKSAPSKASRSKSSREDIDDVLASYESVAGSKPKGRRAPCPRRYNYDVSLWRIPATPKDKDFAKIAELRERIEKEPLVRKHRKALVKLLLNIGKYAEAGAEVAGWRAMDGSNPTVLAYSGDLLRLTGDIDGAIRIYSGILDVKPEDKKTMDMLASYLESKDRRAEAYPFRVSLRLRKTTDHKATARMAIAAAGIDKWDVATREALELVEKSRNGSPKLKRGIRLPRDLKDAVYRIALREKPPLLLNLASRVDARSAKFQFELEWNSDVDLDLWVSNRSNRFLGGSSGSARIVDGGAQSRNEVFYMSSPSQGSYRVQVICAQLGGCGNVAGKLHIRAPHTRRTIPFVLENGAGTDLIKVYIERWRDYCDW